MMLEFKEWVKQWIQKQRLVIQHAWHDKTWQLCQVMSWWRGKWTEICLCLGIYNWSLTPPPDTTDCYAHTYFFTFPIECNKIFSEFTTSGWKHTLTSTVIVVTQLQRTYRWEIVHLFCDVFSHLFQAEPFSASHTTLGWDVLFRSFLSTPLQASFTMLWLFLNILLNKERRDAFHLFFLTLTYWNSNETRLRDSFLFSAESWTKLCRPCFSSVAVLPYAVGLPYFILTLLSNVGVTEVRLFIATPPRSISLSRW